MIYEDFVPIPGFEQYLINQSGVIISKENGKSRKQKVLKTWLNGGYPCVELYKSGVCHKKRVHRLVAETFIDNPANLPFVNHKNMDKLNPHVENLEWCDNSSNQLHRYRKLNTVKDIVPMYLKEIENLIFKIKSVSNRDFKLIEQ
jgi:hypothetical protein